jgi:hypothetical protein
VIVGRPVNKQLQAELTFVGCAPQFATYVGIALVAVITLSKYVVQKADAEAEYLESLKFLRQLSLLQVKLSVAGLGGSAPVAHCAGFGPRTNSIVPPFAKTSL